jgi:ribosome recycling factor
MIDEIQADARSRMSKTIEAFTQELGKIRTGRAHTSLLDHVMVPYYGSEVPINQVATVGVGDAQTLTITPWEKKLIPDVEKAIRSADLGLNPVTTGDIVRVPLPPLTEERRRDLIKVCRHEAEGARVAIRNIRRDANAHLKSLLKDRQITEDEDRKGEKDVQSLTDSYVATVDDMLTKKERDLMEV